MNEKLTVLVNQLHEMGHLAEGCMPLLQKGILNDSVKFLDEGEKKAKDIHKREKKVIEKIVEEAKVNPDARCFVLVADHLERVGDFIENIIHCARIKIQEGIPFSDKAQDELTLLLKKSEEILKQTQEVINARNEKICTFVQDASGQVVTLANQYSTHHEERLVKGLCTPKASSIFLDILDAIKGIAWHSQEITRKICAC